MKMSEFISDLKKEHVEIKNSLDNIDQIGHFNKETRIEMVMVKNLLLKHLEKEDDQVYTSLKKASLNDEHLKNILQYFEDDAKLISEFVVIFFDKYASRNASVDGFMREFNLIYSMIMKRIEQEEEILFPEYEKLQCIFKVIIFIDFYR